MAILKGITKLNKAMFDNVKVMYGMPWLEHNMNVIIDGKKGIVTGCSHSGLQAMLENPKRIVPFHPTWETVYFDKEGNIVADYRTTNEKFSCLK